MRKRTETKQKGSSKPKYPTRGCAWFTIDGYVQKVKTYEKGKCDYITFKVDNTDKYSEIYQDISVKIPWSLDIQVDEGDKIFVEGFIRSYWLEDAGRCLLECVAENIESKDEVPMPKSEPSDEVPFE